MIELTTLIVSLVLLAGLSIPFVIWIAKETIVLFDKAGTVMLKLLDGFRAILYQTGMDVISIWSAGHNSALDIYERRAELEHGREESELALIAKQHKLELSKQYAQLRLKAHRQKLLESETTK